jgi:hypothetical protein
MVRVYLLDRSASRVVSGRGTPVRAGGAGLKNGKSGKAFWRRGRSCIGESGNGRRTNRRPAPIRVLFSHHIERWQRSVLDLGREEPRGAERPGPFFIIPSRIGMGLTIGKSAACRHVHTSAKRRTMRRRIIDFDAFPCLF